MNEEMSDMNIMQNNIDDAMMFICIVCDEFQRMAIG
jgi:hypothetical protein